MGNYVNQVHHTTNMREGREVKIKIIFAWFTFVYAGNMLFCVMNIFTSRWSHIYITTAVTNIT